MERLPGFACVTAHRDSLRGRREQGGRGCWRNGEQSLERTRDAGEVRPGRAAVAALERGVIRRRVDGARPLIDGDAVDRGQAGIDLCPLRRAVARLDATA